MRITPGRILFALGVMVAVALGVWAMLIRKTVIIFPTTAISTVSGWAPIDRIIAVLISASTDGCSCGGDICACNVALDEARKENSAINAAPNWRFNIEALHYVAKKVKPFVPTGPGLLHVISPK
jgi:hypothetical protein